MSRWLDLMTASNSYVIADIMVGIGKGELIIELQPLHASTVAMASVAELKRLQRTDFRRVRVLMRTVREMHNRLLEMTEFVTSLREM
ncbi:hypothetical protein Tco_0822740 [Tanacetum coccineum]|uniref:Cyclic nucleotide-binding domain-containing protein n=1 Tax=Tanacetum coccineum TaxID=301880 RepID=A0ABQ5AGY4_9ASTR